MEPFSVLSSMVRPVMNRTGLTEQQAEEFLQRNSEKILTAMQDACSNQIDACLEADGVRLYPAHALAREAVTLSTMMELFFENEIDNELADGDSPSTLQSAIDSFKQTPMDDFIEICDLEDQLTPTKGGVEYSDEFREELQSLYDRWGGLTELRDLLDGGAPDAGLES